MFLLFAVTGCKNEEENGTISREAFPDLRFEQYMLQNFDTDSDGQISFAEAKAVRDIDCSDMGITSLKGIQYFTALETLNCSLNAINALDLTQNTALRSFTCNLCEQIEIIDLSKNTALEYLSCSGNANLKSLYISDNTNLRELFCDDNRSLASLNPDGNTDLRILSCNRNASLLSLNLSNNTNLRELSCIRANSGNIVTITGLTGYHLLEKLTLNGVAIETIGIAGSPLKELDCEIAVQPSVSIDLSGCNKLEAFRFTCINGGSVFDQEAQNINLTGCTVLNTLEINQMFFKSLDISSCTSLRKLIYEEGDVDISKNTELEEVNVRDILGDIPNLRKLKTLYFRLIKNVETLDLSNQTVMENLRCSVLDIPMNISNCKALRTFYMNNHFFDNDDAIRISAINLKDFPVLERVTADDLMDRVSLNIENCPVLKSIAGEKLATLNVSGCASLEEAIFRCNAFNINNCPNIIHLGCNGSPVGTLHLDSFTKLERLYCENCSLTTLDLRKNKNVNTLQCSNNPDLKYIELTRGHEIPHKSIGEATLRYWDEAESGEN
jgi:hypothetical protein